MFTEELTILTGKTFGKWTVFERVENRHGAIYYMCQCACGIKAPISKKALEYGTSKSCGCSRNRNRLRENFGKRFSPREEFLLRKYYSNHGPKKVAVLLHRTPSSIIHKAAKLRIRLKGGAKRGDTWSEQEKDILKHYYPIGGVAACLPFLPNRTKNAIWVKAGKMHIYYSEVQRKRAA